VGGDFPPGSREGAGAAGDTYPKEECRRWVLEKTSMYSTTVARAWARVAKSAPWTSSFCSDAKKLSIGALSQQSARRLMLQAMPCLARSRWECALAYGLPRSEWASSPAPGSRGGLHPDPGDRPLLSVQPAVPQTGGDPGPSRKSCTILYATAPRAAV
jgi:hypothetical protein